MTLQRPCETEPQADRGPSFWSCVFLTLVSVSLAWLAFPPYSIYLMGFVAYWPLMAAMEGSGPGRALFLSVVWGWAAAILGLWSFTTVWGGPLFFAVVSVPGFLTSVKVFAAWACGGRRGCGAIGWPLGWALIDFAWLWACPVLPYAIAGYPLVGRPGSADLLWAFGAPGAGFLVMSVNRAIHLAASRRGSRDWHACAISVVLLLAAASLTRFSSPSGNFEGSPVFLPVERFSSTPGGKIGSGSQSDDSGHGHTETEEMQKNTILRELVHRRELGIVLLQGCIDQARKSKIEYRTRIVSTYLELAGRGATSIRLAKGDPDFPVLAIWPETSTPGILRNSAEDFDEVSEFCRNRSISMIIGTRDLLTPDSSGGSTYFNSAVLLNRDGVWTRTYDKVIPATFAETGPYEGSLSFLNRLRVVDHKVQAGPGPVIFNVPCRGGVMGFGTVICYESLFPGLLARNMAAGAEVVLNLSNDAWFHGTSEPDHLVQETLARAMTLGVTVLRASNTGVTFAAVPEGVVASIGLLERGFLAGVLASDLPEPWDAGVCGSFWYIWRDWLILASLAFLAMSIGFEALNVGCRGSGRCQGPRVSLSGDREPSVQEVKCDV